MRKFLVLSVIVAGVIGGGCATSNRDYSASSLVVDVTDPHSTVSAPTATVHQYNKNSQVVNANAAAASSRQNQTQSQVSYVNNENINSVALENNYGSNTQSSGALEPVDANSNTAVSASANTINASDRYQVVKGDTLYSIAFRYGLDYRDLAKKNGIEPPYNIAVGQVLALNLSSAKAPQYIVKKGDTLYSIARANGQSVDLSLDGGKLVITESGDYEMTLSSPAGMAYILSINVDNIPPEIELVKGDDDSVTLAGISKENITISATKDGEELSCKVGQTFSENGEEVITVTDELGNVSKVTFEIPYRLSTVSIVIIVVGAVAVTGFIILFVVKRKIKS